VYLIGDQVQGTVAGSTTLFLSSTRISANVWTMISVEREGSVHRLYINGVLEASSSTANRPDNGVFAIGRNGFGDFNGYIDELRLSSVARYGGTSFTEPTENYAVDSDTTALLHFDGANGSTDIANETEGGVKVLLGLTIEVAGFEVTSFVGSVTTASQANVFPIGSQATTEIGTVFVWDQIAPGPDGNWQGIDDSQTPTWVAVDDSQTPGWSTINDSQTPSWGTIDDSQSPDWKEVA